MTTQDAQLVLKLLFSCAQSGGDSFDGKHTLVTTPEEHVGRFGETSQIYGVRVAARAWVSPERMLLLSDNTLEFCDAAWRARIEEIPQPRVERRRWSRERCGKGGCSLYPGHAGEHRSPCCCLSGCDAVGCTNG